MLIAKHGVRFAGARDAIREQKPVLSGQQVFDEWQADLFEELFLRARLVKYLVKRVDQLLDLAVFESGRTLGYLQHEIVNVECFEAASVQLEFVSVATR